jgi:protein transport protein SEC24
VNPGFNFIEGGAQLVCNLCGQINPTAGSVYSYNTDKSSLPELHSGSYEFTVGGRYVYHPMRSPTYVFVIDSTIEAQSSGLFTSVLNSITSALDSIPNPVGTKIGIITVDTSVHCYNVPTAEAQP